MKIKIEDLPHDVRQLLAEAMQADRPIEVVIAGHRFEGFPECVSVRNPDEFGMGPTLTSIVLSRVAPATTPRGE